MKTWGSANGREAAGGPTCLESWPVQASQGQCCSCSCSGPAVPEVLLLWLLGSAFPPPCFSVGSVHRCLCVCLWASSVGNTWPLPWLQPPSSSFWLLRDSLTSDLGNPLLRISLKGGFFFFGTIDLPSVVVVVVVLVVAVITNKINQNPPLCLVLWEMVQWWWLLCIQEVCSAFFQIPLSMDMGKSSWEYVYAPCKKVVH